MIAGHDTTAGTLAFTLREYAMASPAQRDKIEQEVDMSFRTVQTGSTDHATIQQQPKPQLLMQRAHDMPALQQFIKESMRMWPVAANGGLRTVCSVSKYQLVILQMAIETLCC